MARLYLGNFHFEHQLADPSDHPSARLARLNAELAPCWLAIAQEGDGIYCPEPVPDSFWDRMASLSLPRIVPVTNWTTVPPGTELVPWGWTAAAVRLAARFRWKTSAPDVEVVRDVNARRFSFDLEAEWGVGLPGMTLVRDGAQLDKALRQVWRHAPRAVIKANWSMSARERIFVDGELNDPQRAWVDKRLRTQGTVFVEPWVDRLEEVGIQIDVPREGRPTLVGLASLVGDELGQYRGSWFTDPPDPAGDFSRRWDSAVEIALQAAGRIQERGYFGPVGIDAVRFQLSDGTAGVRPLQDINARWTMGRLSLGWRRLLHPGELGFWRHGRAGEIPPCLESGTRIVPVSPDRIGDRPAERSAVLVFFEPDAASAETS